MTKFYSKTTGGFYDSAIHTSMPADALSITDQQWQDALDGQSQGKLIQADANGLPIAVLPAAPNPNDAIQQQIDEIERATICNRGAREGWIALMLQQAAALTTPKTQADLLDPVTGNPYFRKLVEVDTQIRALRAQLT